jgi:hypothetical protein
VRFRDLASNLSQVSQLEVGSGSTPDSVLLFEQGEANRCLWFLSRSAAMHGKSSPGIDVYAPDPELTDGIILSCAKLHCVKHRHQAHASILDTEFASSVPTVRFDTTRREGENRGAFLDADKGPCENADFKLHRGNSWGPPHKFFAEARMDLP